MRGSRKSSRMPGRGAQGEAKQRPLRSNRQLLRLLSWDGKRQGVPSFHKQGTGSAERLWEMGRLEVTAYRGAKTVIRGAATGSLPLRKTCQFPVLRKLPLANGQTEAQPREETCLGSDS